MYKLRQDKLCFCKVLVRDIVGVDSWRRVKLIFKIGNKINEKTLLAHFTISKSAIHLFVTLNMM